MSITVQNLHFSYGSHPVLSDVSFAVEGGHLVSVLGANGVGKSTLFRCILGLLSSYTGSIWLNGVDLRTLTARQRANRMAYIPQSHGRFFNYTVFDMVLMGTSHQLAPFASPGPKQMQAAETALEQAGIQALAHKNFHCLSGGEQQLVMIARALAQQVPVFLMDEPTANLDYGNQARVMELVKHLAQNGYTILLSTHNPQHALTYANTILALAEGEVAAFGRPEEVMDEALIRLLYGVQTRLIQVGSTRLVVPSPEAPLDVPSFEARCS